MFDQSITQPPPRRRWLRALLLLMAIKSVWLCFDAIPRLFLGDSASYLLAATSGWMPPDRSFTYPWLLRILVMPWQSPYALIVVQSVAGVASAWLLWQLLRRRFGVSEMLALLAAAAFACDPAQVFYERMVMAEAFGGLALMATFAATVEYVATTRMRWLFMLECLGLATVSLRLNLLPVVLVMGVIAPLLLWSRHAEKRRIAVHLMVALALLGGLHGGYRHYIAHRFGTGPAWSARSEFMELGLVAPLVKPEHLWAEGISPNMLSLLRYDLHDPFARHDQMWSPFGLCDVLGLHDSAAGDALAGRIAKHALRDDPMGLLRLGMINAAGYFNPQYANIRLLSDRASERPYAPEVQALAASVLKTAIAGTEKLESPARRWFTFAVPWLVFCWLALVPLAALACWRLRRDGRTSEASVLLLYALGLACTQLLFSSIISYRYLHPMPAFALIALAILLAPRSAVQQRVGDGSPPSDA
jgi:hypothetical protein